MVAATALTLTDYALLSNDPLVQAITWSLIDYGVAFQDIPMITKESMRINGSRIEGNLPTINWAQINAPGVTIKGVPVPWQEQIYVTRNYIDVDELYVRDQNQIVDPRSQEADIVLKALAYELNYRFINNEHVAGDKNCFVGIRSRIDNGSVYGVRSENKLDASGVDITHTGLGTASNMLTFLELLDKLLWLADSPEGMGVILYMNDNLIRRVDMGIKSLGTQGGFAITQDNYGRSVTKYKNAVIRDPGLKADQSTRIITNTENADGTDGSSNYTSIYAVNYNMGHFGGWHYEPIQVQDLGLQPDGVIYRTIVKYAAGLYNSSNRSLARLYDIKYS
jgi:hypothetical protein